jgi:hypothetical protein
MTGWNLPPGVNVSDIPGNRPEDEMEEIFWEALDEDLRKLGKYSEAELDMVGVEGLLTDAIYAAREIAYKVGFDEGRAEEQLAQAYKESQDAKRD